MTPLYGFLEGDTIGLLLLAEADDTIGALADRLVRAASVRVQPAAVTAVLHDQRPLSLEATVAEAGLTDLERIDVRTDVRTDARTERDDP
jgi:hypothetical protein